MGLHPGKLTAGYPKWWALEKVTPFKHCWLQGETTSFIGVISPQRNQFIRPLKIYRGPPCTTWDGFCWCHPVGICHRWLCNYVDRGPVFFAFLVWPAILTWGGIKPTCGQQYWQASRPQNFKVILLAHLRLALFTARSFEFSGILDVTH